MNEYFTGNPFEISPRGHANNIVGREDVFLDFVRILGYVASGKFCPMIVRGEIGGGKSTLFRNVKTQIDLKKFNVPQGKCLVVHTTLNEPSLSHMVKVFMEKLVFELPEQEKGLFLDFKRDLENTVTKQGIQALYHQFMYVETLDYLKMQGYVVIIHIVDEMEVLSESNEMEIRRFLHNLRDLIDEVGARGLLMMFGCTDEAYRLMGDFHPALISRIPQQLSHSVDIQLEFTFENTLDFIAHRLDQVRIKSHDNPYFPLTRDGVVLIHKHTRSNVRLLEQVAYFVMETYFQTGTLISEIETQRLINETLQSGHQKENQNSTLGLVENLDRRNHIKQTFSGHNPEEMAKLIQEGWETYFECLSFEAIRIEHKEHSSLLYNLQDIRLDQYKSVAIRVCYFGNLYGKEYLATDFIDLGDLQKSRRAHYGFLWSMHVDSSDQGNFIHLPETSAQELACLPYLARADAVNVAMRLERQLNAILKLNAYITKEQGMGRIITYKFKENEVSLYLSIWKMGLTPKTEEEIWIALGKNRISRKMLKVKLDDLLEKKYIERQGEYYSVPLNPVVQYIYDLATNSFHGDPFTLKDLSPFIVCDSFVTLRRCLDIMVGMRVLEEVTVGGSQAFQILSIDDIQRNCNEIQKEVSLFFQNDYKLPIAVRGEINVCVNRIEELNKRIFTTTIERVVYLGLKWEIYVQLRHIYQSQISAGKETQSLIEQIRSSGSEILKICETLEYQGLSTTDINKRIEAITKSGEDYFNRQYIIQGKDIRNKLQESLETINSLRNELKDQEQRYTKFSYDLEGLKQLMPDISTISTYFNLAWDHQAINDVQKQITDAQAYLKNHNFLQAEHIIIRLFQTPLITGIIHKLGIVLTQFNQEFADLSKFLTTLARGTNLDKKLHVEYLDLKFQLQSIQGKYTNGDYLATYQLSLGMTQQLNDLSEELNHQLLKYLDSLTSGSNKGISLVQLSTALDSSIEMIVNLLLPLFRKGTLKINVA